MQSNPRSAVSSANTRWKIQVTGQNYQPEAFPSSAGMYRFIESNNRRQSDAKILRIAPTVMKNVTWDDAIMGEEIFGPILPILTYESLDEAIQTVESHPHPLALYFFSEDKAAQKKVLDRCHFGGGCINDTIIHLATSAMPFGGVGESGMGGYHGQAGFDEFTHYRSIVDKKTWMDLPVRYQRYNKFKRKMLRMFLK